MRLIGLLAAFLQDLRFAGRHLLRSPGFTIASVLTLAVSIGSTTAIFSIVEGVLIRPFPYHEPDRLVQVVSTYRGAPNSTVSGPSFLDWRQQVHKTVSDAALVNEASFTLLSDSEPERLESARASFNLFSVLGVQPLVGRLFTADDDKPGSPNVVILSENLWRRRFGADRSVLGRTIQLSGRINTIIGVVPHGSGFPPSGPALWALLPFSGDVSDPSNRGALNYRGIGRLAPEASLAEAQAATKTVGYRLAKQYPESNAGWGLGLEPLTERLVGEIRKPLLMLLGAVGLVLLIACANVANLLLARATYREAEIGVRSALGAGRGRLVAQLVTESLVLAFLGGILGLLLASWLVHVLLTLAPDRVPRLDEVHLDQMALLFSTGLVVATGLLFGLMPAFRASQPDLASSIRQGGRGGQSRAGNSRTRSTLVVTEVALAVMLLCGAGLLIRSFAHLMAVDLGFRTAQVLSFRISLPSRTYSDPGRLRGFANELVQRMRGFPGTRSAALAFGLPFGEIRTSVGFEIEGAAPWPTGQTEVLLTRIVTPDYFQTMGIPLVKGRPFSEHDRANSPRVAILNQAAVHRYFPGQEAISRRIRLGWGPVDGEKLEGEIVGIVADTKQYGIDQSVEPEIFFPYEQAPVGSLAGVIRSSASPATVAKALRRQLKEIDPEVPIFDFQRMDDLIAASFARHRFYMILLVAFAVLALLLASIGIYGIVSYVAAQRRREVAIRMALGATREQVLGLIVRQGVKLSLIGGAIGLVGAFILNRSLTSLLFEVDPYDPATLISVTVVLLLIALFASYIPGRRVSRINLQRAIREE